MREAAALNVGDVIALEIEGDHPVVHRVRPRQDHDLQGLCGVSASWRGTRRRTRTRGVTSGPLDVVVVSFPLTDRRATCPDRLIGETSRGHGPSIRAMITVAASDGSSVGSIRDRSDAGLVDVPCDGPLPAVHPRSHAGCPQARDVAEVGWRSPEESTRSRPGEQVMTASRRGLHPGVRDAAASAPAKLPRGTVTGGTP